MVVEDQKVNLFREKGREIVGIGGVGLLSTKASKNGMLRLDSRNTSDPARSLRSRFCSGQLIPDTTLSFSSARAGANPSLN